MHEELEYAEMIEIPVSTVNVIQKRRRKKKATVSRAIDEGASLKESVIHTVNGRLEEEEKPSLSATEEEGRVYFGEDERIDTVRLYSTGSVDEELIDEDFSSNEGGMYEMNPRAKAVNLALRIEFGVACALCGAIFLTNVFLPQSAINTFFRALNTPTEETAKLYSDFTLSPVVSELSSAELTLSPEGVLSFTDECCVYPAADGKVLAVTKNEEGAYTVTLGYSASFTGILQGLDSVYYGVGDTVKTNVPIGYSLGEREVQVTMYSNGELLNCFELTDENCLAWIPAEE